MAFLCSSRRRHTSCLSDWSSDVCSSDLAGADVAASPPGPSTRRYATFASRYAATTTATPSTSARGRLRSGSARKSVVEGKGVDHGSPRSRDKEELNRFYRRPADATGKRG